MPPEIAINDLTVTRSCVIFLPPVYPLHLSICKNIPLVRTFLYLEKSMYLIFDGLIES